MPSVPRGKTRFKLKGRVVARLLGPDGKLKQIVEADNTIVTTGRVHIRDLLIGSSPTPMAFMGYGSGLIAVTLADTSLGTEETVGGYAREATVKSGPTATSMLFTAVWPTGFTSTINEASIFDAVSAGIMFSRVVFGSPTIKASGDTFQVDWTIQVTS